MKKLLEVEVLKEEEAGTTIEVSGTGFNNRLRVDTRLLHEFDEECHCGKDGHALNSINCPKHGSISERNANPDTLTATIIAREGEERLRLVRNALIDELIEEVDRIELCRHDMVRIFVLLESKKK